ncbi:MAG: hypothetical protein JW976_15735 [Syntrophaceae bacterium]|nr:hypothetical protein [Syntrophaceae bacterium]
MDYNNIILNIIGWFIALSGWGTVIYNHVTSTPKIKGRLLNVMRGSINNISAFITYAYLINVRKNTINMLDYEMEIKVDDRWIRLNRVYGIHNIQTPEFFAPDRSKIEITGFSNNLIYRKNAPVEYGKPLHGWIIFTGDKEIQNKDICVYKLTCVDAYNKRHTFESKPDEFINLFLLQDIADIKNIPESAKKQQ